MAPKRKSTRQYLKSNKRLRGMTFGQRSAESVRSKSKFTRVLRSTGRKGEIKAVDYPNGAPLQITAMYNPQNMTIYPVNLVQAGSSFFNRVGRKIEMKSLHIHGKILPAVGAAANLNAQSLNTAEYSRIIVFYDRQVNGAVPAYTDILQNTDQAGNPTTSAYSDINLNNRERFVILMDERRFLPAVPPAGTTTIPAFGSNEAATDGSLHFNRFIKLKGLLTHFKADSSPAVIGDIATGGLFVAIMSDLATPTGGAGSTPTYQYATYWTARLRYDDT